MFNFSQPIFDKDLLTKYITYAREYVTPKLSGEAADRLVKAYTDMRHQGNNKNVISATPRQLESMIRISEAFAKMRLSNIVTIDDVNMAIDLIMSALAKAATDPETGVINMTLMATGLSSGDMKRIDEIAKNLKGFFESNSARYRKPSKVADLREEYHNKFGTDRKDKTLEKLIVDALKELQNEDLVALMNSDRTFKLTKDLNVA